MVPVLILSIVVILFAGYVISSNIYWKKKLGEKTKLDDELWTQIKAN